MILSGTTQSDMEHLITGVRKRLPSSGTSCKQGSSVFNRVIDHERPVHVPQDSLFSGSSGWKDYRGFFNLAILLLFVSNGRVALENIIKYGILISPGQWIKFLALDPWWKSSNFALLLLSNISVLLVLYVEKFIASGRLGNRDALIIYLCFFPLHIFLPAVVTLSTHGNPVYSVFTLSVYVVLFLKLISFIHTNYWLRLNVEKHDDNLEKAGYSSFPHNLTFSNLYYFIFAPTLCYELKYPRSPSRRKMFMLKRATELLCLTFIIIALCQQWVVPLLKNSVKPLTEMKIGMCIERVLKLAIPNHVIWLIFFYTIFHSALNLAAEIMQFADRQFYLDFWNSESIVVFWKTWNIPIHRWALRHIYKPLIRNGYSKFTASFVVFLVSAFFHEYLVSVPLHMYRLWAFFCMMAQIPLSILTEKIIGGGRVGNILMWLSLILGQPLTILMYVHDWYVINNPIILNNSTIPIAY